MQVDFQSLEGMYKHWQRVAGCWVLKYASRAGQELKEVAKMQLSRVDEAET